MRRRIVPLVLLLLVAGSMAAPSVSAAPAPRFDWQDGAYIRGGDFVDVSGSVSPAGPLSSLELSTDGGSSWYDITGYYNPSTGRWTFRWATTYLPSGSYTLKLQARDTSGGSGMAYITVWLDGEDPVLTPAPLARAAYPVSDPIIITGTASDNLGIKRIEVSPDGGATWTVADGKEKWQYRWDTVGKSTGTYSIMARCVDNAGRNVTATVSIFLDAELPEVRITEPPSTQPIVAGALVTVKGTAADNRRVVNLSFSGDGGARWSNITSSLAPGGDWAWQWNTSGLALGPRDIFVRAEDEAGNLGMKSKTFTLVDGTPPLLVITQPNASYPSFQLGGLITLGGIARDDVGLSAVEVSLDNATWTDITSTMLDENFTYDWNTTGSIPGRVTVTVRASDKAGNYIVRNKSLLIVDSVKPLIVVYSPKAGSNLSADEPVVLVGRAEDAAGITELSVKIDAGPWVNITAQMTGKDWRYTVGRLKAGTHTIRVRAADGSGLVSEHPFGIEILKRTVSTPASQGTWYAAAAGAGVTVAVILFAAILFVRKRKEGKVEEGPPIEPLPVVQRSYADTVVAHSHYDPGEGGFRMPQGLPEAPPSPAPSHTAVGEGERRGPAHPLQPAVKPSPQVEAEKGIASAEAEILHRQSKALILTKADRLLELAKSFHARGDYDMAGKYAEKAKAAAMEAKPPTQKL